MDTGSSNNSAPEPDLNLFFIPQTNTFCAYLN